MLHSGSGFTHWKGYPVLKLSLALKATGVPGKGIWDELPSHKRMIEPELCKCMLVWCRIPVALSQYGYCPVNHSVVTALSALFEFSSHHSSFHVVQKCSALSGLQTTQAPSLLD